MKYLFSFVMAVLISLPSHSADEYRLPFVELQNGVTKIPFVEHEWTLAVERADWYLFVENGMLKEHKDIYEFHATTVYKKPFYNDAVKTDVSKIYTYGVLNCKEANLYILFEWFVDPDETLVFRGSHEFGAYTVEMKTPLTARNDVYNQVCKERI
jgi:hypothetical protein